MQLTRILGVSADALLGIDERSEKRNGPVKNRKLRRQVQALDKLSKRDPQLIYS